jgi:hypothetical protein
MAAARRALTVTDDGCEQVCSRCLPESVTVSMSGERPATWYRPGGSQAENFPDAPTPTRTGRCPVEVNSQRVNCLALQRSYLARNRGLGS